MSYYKTNLTLAENHDWDLEYFDNCYPYERDLYTGLLIIQMREKQEQAEKVNQQIRG
jgi:hypothetical protein